MIAMDHISKFKPLLTPYEMLELGVFDGSYYEEYSDFKDAPVVRKKNLFASDVSSSKDTWIRNGWITPEDPLGWFQWYVRFWHGRRVESVDKFQIGRWCSFVARHGAQVKKNGNGDSKKRVRQRQCLIHWAADPIPDIEIEDKVSYLKGLK
jgi:hypothetical protein